MNDTPLPISTFRVEHQRGIGIAFCDDVPPVTVITGPNGSGKSTLLIGIKRQHQAHQPIYLGPHRAIRRQHIQSRWLGPQMNLSDILAGDHVNRIEGINIYDQARDPWNADETGNFIKYSLCNIATDVNGRLARIFYRDGEIKKGALPDVWKPLSDLVNTLLPHLKFEEVDVSNKQQMMVQFKNVKTNTVIEFDELSSGEKSVLQLFLPLIEKEVLYNLELIDNSEAVISWQVRPVIIDEPELHLHPNLQELLLTYMRELAAAGRYQFIISSHSQTLVEAANSDELFLLKPIHAVADGENQLTRIASDDDKLDLISEVFGRRSDLTAMRNVLVVEGKEVTPFSQSSSDRKIYGLLDKRFQRLTVLPSSSKTECVARARSLAQVMAEIGSTAQVNALVDRDATDSDDDALIKYLPVSMVENFLVDPDVIFDGIELIRDKTDFETRDNVENAIDSILDSMEDHEVARRVKAKLGHVVFRVTGKLDRAEEQVDQQKRQLDQSFSSQRIEELRILAAEDVNKIKTAGQRRELYDGKHIIDQLFKLYLGSTGLSKEIFKYQCAKIASDRKVCRNFFEDLFSALPQ